MKSFANYLTFAEISRVVYVETEFYSMQIQYVCICVFVVFVCLFVCLFSLAAV